MTLVLTLLANAVVAGEIRRFTDSNGTVHINNVGSVQNPETSGEAQRPIYESLPGKLPTISPGFESLQETQRGATAPAWLDNPLNYPPLETGVLANQSDGFEELIQAVYEAAKKLGAKSASMEKPFYPEEIPAVPRLAQAASGDRIISYKGPEGIIHIVSRPEGSITPSSQVGEAPPSEEKSSQPDASLQAFQQCFWPGLPTALASVPSTISFAALSSYSVRLGLNYYGGLGVMNTPPAESPPIPTIPLAQIVDASYNQTSPGLPDLGPGSARAAGQTAGLPRASPQTIFARRDSRGVCHIFNIAASGSLPDPGGFASLVGKIPPELEPIIVEASNTYRLPVPLILALIRNESNFAHLAVSPKGAMGLMQLMPDTAALLGVQDPFSPRENILGGCRYFRFLLDYFQGSLPLALAAYNAGSQRVISAGYQVPQIRETQGFVTQVMGLYYLLEKLAALRL